MSKTQKYIAKNWRKQYLKSGSSEILKYYFFNIFLGLPTFSFVLLLVFTNSNTKLNVGNQRKIYEKNFKCLK